MHSRKRSIEGRYRLFREATTCVAPADNIVVPTAFGDTEPLQAVTFVTISDIDRTRDHRSLHAACAGAGMRWTWQSEGRIDAALVIPP